MSLIVGLFTGVLSAGGVQRAGRHVAAVTARYASDRGMGFRFLSLNDPQGLHAVRVGSLEFSVSGHAESKPQFVLASLRTAGRKPALVIALHPHLSPVAWAMKARCRSFRSVVFAHGIEVWQPLGRLRGLAFRQADLIVAPSTDTLQRLVSTQRVDRGQVRRLPWGIDPEFQSQLDAPAPLPTGFPLTGRIVLTVGRLDSSERYKGADTLISALPRILKVAPDVILVLVGEGDDRPRLEQFARDLGVADHACFLSGLTPEQLSACYGNCDVFALPSAREGFGFVFLEAMAYAKPVIGGAHGAIPEIIEDGVTGILIPHGDAQRLARALESILCDPNRARQMGALGKDRLAAQFSFARFELGLTNIFDEVLGQKLQKNADNSND